MRDYSDTNNFNFNLEWDELPEDFREEKIDEYMRKQYDDLGMTDEEKEEHPVEEYLENENVRSDVDNSIKAHFPIYF